MSSQPQVAENKAGVGPLIAVTVMTVVIGFVTLAFSGEFNTVGYIVTFGVAFLISMMIMGAFMSGKTEQEANQAAKVYFERKNREESQS